MVRYWHTLQQDNKVSRAKEAFEKALDIDPELIEVLGNLGAIESSAGNLDKSLEYNNRVLQLNPNSFEAHNNVGITLRKLGQLREPSQRKACNRVEPKFCKCTCKFRKRA